MKCAWKELLAILPSKLSREVDRRGKEDVQEIRLRLGKTPQLLWGRESVWLDAPVTGEDIQFCVNMASRYSPWAAQSIADGYITAQGGHRIGICGEAIMQQGKITGIRQAESLCIRVARDFPGIGRVWTSLRGSILVLGPPGSGKTTLLRDICRGLSGKETVAVVDERGELFPECFDRGQALDVLTGCRKAEGIDMVLKTMGPHTIAVDEITSEADAAALLRAGWCGVRLLATAHAANFKDLKSRPVYRSILAEHLFDHILILSRDKSRPVERMDL